MLGCTEPIALDTSEPVRPSTFSLAVLEPAFEHGNAVWAGVALLDYDRDGWLDIFFTNGESQPDALYRNSGDGSFENVSAAAGVDSLERHGGVVAGDIDNDGDIDLAVTTECSVGTLTAEGEAIPDGDLGLFINQGDGSFEPAELGADLDEIFVEGLCPISLQLFDVDGDGNLDLSVDNGLDPDQVFPWVFRKEVREAVDQVLLGTGDGQFIEPMTLVNTPGGGDDLDDEIEFQYVSFTSAFIDLNGDGRPERIVGYGGGPIAVYVHQDDGSLEVGSFYSSTGEGLWMGLAVADYDGDSDLDIYATNQGLSPLILGYDNIPEPIDPEQGIYPFHSMIMNNSGRLVRDLSWPIDAQWTLAGDLFDGLPDPETGEPRYPEWMNPEDLERYSWAWGAVAIDYDSDGWADVAYNGNNCSAPMDIIWDEARGAGPGILMRNLEGEAFRDVTWELGVQNIDGYGRYQDGRGIAVGDLNNDGFQDLVYANRTYNPTQSDPLAQVPGDPRVLLNPGTEYHWIQLELVGSVSNRDGIGTVVYVDDGSRQWVAQMGAGGGTNSSSERMLTIGLGTATSVDLEVVFPSGETQVLSGLDVDQRVEVFE
jgi:hypothetical protein